MSKLIVFSHFFVWYSSLYGIINVANNGGKYEIRD